jgi:hypothetical protein
LKESQDDAALHESLAVLKERDMERRLPEQFSLILKAEQDIGADSLAWEIDQAKASLQSKVTEVVDAFREPKSNRVQTICNCSERADGRSDQCVENSVPISILELGRLSRNEKSLEP